MVASSHPGTAQLPAVPPHQVEGPVERGGDGRVRLNGQTGRRPGRLASDAAA